MSKETDWKKICSQLAGKLLFALENMRPTIGSGLMMSNGEMKHWKIHFAETLELIPGVKVDRESLFKKPKSTKGER